MDATWWAVFFAVTVLAFAVVAWLDGHGTGAMSPPRTSPVPSPTPVPSVAAESVFADTAADTSDDEVSSGNRRPKGLDT